MTSSSERRQEWREQKRAAGFVFRRGRPVYQPDGPRWWAGLRPHGTVGRYKQKCRCVECRAANAAATRERTRKLRGD